MIRVTVAVPTFRRLAYLPSLLNALAALQVPPNIALRLVIADNDPAASARASVLEAADRCVRSLTYLHVAARGLSSVRNAILADAMEHADLLAMLDDDELPQRDWLGELLQCAQATGADAVMGAVRTLLPPEVPNWFRRFRDREHPNFTDGASLYDGWSSNCLVRMDAIRGHALRFDSTLNFVGGEDQLFFRALRANGGTISYAKRAVVWEIVPPARRSPLFVLKRSFRRGTSLATCDRQLRHSRIEIALRALKGVATVGLSLLSLPIACIRGRALDRCFEIARGLGMIFGLLGFRYAAYRVTN